MTEIKTEQTPTFSDFDQIDAQMRSVILNVILVIGIVATTYFGIHDTVLQRTLASVASLFVVTLFSLALILNILHRRFRAIISFVLVMFIGIGFLALLATQFPHPTISLWCFTFPLLTLFLLGQKQGLAAVVVFNVGVICIFVLDRNLHWHNFTYDYIIRYCGVLLVISVTSYYFEASRARSRTKMNALNRSLEQRVEERTKTLEESQERLRQTEKLESIGLLAGGIAHDFNNQLTGIMAYADLIRITAKDNPEIQESVEGILTSSRRSAELTSQLLAFARKGNFLAIPVDIHHVVADIISLLKHTIDKRISIRQQLNANPSTILGDPTQLHSALLNISLNARDAMPIGGELNFATDIVDLEDEYCSTLHGKIKPGTYLHLSITDTGSGMDKEVLQHIFEPFFTTKKQGKGTGMGLPAIYGTVLSHKGAIDVDSEPGQGSTFSLYFAIYKTAVQIINPSLETVPPEMNSGHILLVDDEPIAAESCKKLLNLLGCTVTKCENGKEALDYYRNNWKSVDLVILDMVMPVMDGKDAFIAMKKINPDIITLLSSGYSLSGEAQSILDMGARDFIQKPFTLSELQQQIAPLLAERT